jgi:hypothetical protein
MEKLNRMNDGFWCQAFQLLKWRQLELRRIDARPEPQPRRIPATKGVHFQRDAA